MLFRLMVIVGLVSILVTEPVVAQDNFEAEIDNLAKTMAKNLQTLGKKKVAVVDFLDCNDNSTIFSRFLAEELSVSLSIVDESLAVYERSNLNSIIKEQKLSTKAVFEPGMAQKIGKLANVDILVTGRYTDLTDRIRITSKMIDTTTGKLKAVRGSMALTPTFQKLLGSGCGQQSGLGGQSIGVLNSGDGVKKATIVASTIVENIKFEVIKAHRRGGQLELVVVATNLQEDREVYVFLSRNHEYPQTVISDNLGKEYIPREIKVGVNTAKDKGRDGDFSFVRNVMVKGIPKQIIMTFNAVNDIQVLHSLVLGGRINDRSRVNFRVKFKNIPISYK